MNRISADLGAQRLSDNLIEEGEAVVVVGSLGVHAANELLGVVAKKLEDGNHGKAAVGELLGLGLLELFCGLSLALSVTKGEEAPVVDGTDEEDHLHPAKGGDGLDGGNTVGDGGEGDARGDLSGELEHFGDDVSEDGKLGYASVLELSSAVIGEGLRIDVGGEAKGVEEANGGDGTELALEAHLEGRAGASHAGGGEGRSRGEEGGEEGGAVGNEGREGKEREEKGERNVEWER